MRANFAIMKRLFLTLLAALSISGPAAADVAVDNLQRIDFLSEGLPGGDLGNGLWSSSMPPTVVSLMAQINGRALTPAGRRLYRRLLLTGASSPNALGTDPDAGAARARGLIFVGEYEAAYALFDRAPGLASSAPLSQAVAEAALLNGATNRACQVAKSLAVSRGEIYWLRLRAFCQAEDGDLEAAQTTFSLAEESSHDAVFARMMGVLLAQTGSPGAPSSRNGLERALSIKLGLDVPKPAGPADDPARDPDGEALLAAMHAGRWDAIDDLMARAASATGPDRLRLQGRALICIALTDSVGESRRVSELAFDAGPRSSLTGLAYEFDNAVTVKDRGGVVLMALAITSANPTAADYITVIRGLHRVGLNDAAEDFAREAFLKLATPKAAPPAAPRPATPPRPRPRGR